MFSFLKAVGKAYPRLYRVRGEIVLQELPEYRGMLLSVRRHPKGSPGATHVEELLQEVHQSAPRTESVRSIPFDFSWPEGDYVVEIRPILLRLDWKGRIIAQSEPSMMTGQPLHLHAPQLSLQYRLTWPSIPLEELADHGVVHPHGDISRD